jgi:hypothetical protein
MYLKIQNKRLASFKYLKKFKMKKSRFWAFEKIRIKEPLVPIILRISKN